MTMFSNSLHLTLLNDTVKAHADPTNAIWKRSAIFQFSKVNKTVSLSVRRITNYIRYSPDTQAIKQSVLKAT
jgi:hypothetical protein